MSSKQYTKAIVLGRIDFGDSDRILSLLTPDHGKVHLMAKGVRKPTSKLAGGIELFSEVEVGFVTGKGDLGTLVSSRLLTFYKNILSDIEKVQAMYEVLKTIDQVTEDNAESDYYYFVEKLMKIADNPKTRSLPLSLYFKAQLLRLTGHLPDFRSDSKNVPLDEKSSYSFSFDSMSMAKSSSGRFKSRHIKYLRLLFNGDEQRIFNLADADSTGKDIRPLIDAMMKSSLSI